MKKTRAPRPPRDAHSGRGKPARNPRGEAQTRRVLGRHYAAKYRAGRD